MFGVTAKIEDKTRDVKREADKTAITGLSKAGWETGKEMRQSIERSAESSEPGQPVTTRKGRVRIAIRYAVDKPRQNVVIGPRASIVGQSMEAHEYGKRYKGTRYPERPTARPALARVAPRLGPMFRFG